MDGPAVLDVAGDARAERVHAGAGPGAQPRPGLPGRPDPRGLPADRRARHQGGQRPRWLGGVRARQRGRLGARRLPGPREHPDRQPAARPLRGSLPVDGRARLRGARARPSSRTRWTRSSRGWARCQAALAATGRYSHPGFLAAYGEWQFSQLEKLRALRRDLGALLHVPQDHGRAARGLPPRRGRPRPSRSSRRWASGSTAGSAGSPRTSSSACGPSTSRASTAA